MNLFHIASISLPYRVDIFIAHCFHAVMTIKKTYCYEFLPSIVHAPLTTTRKQEILLRINTFFAKLVHLRTGYLMYKLYNGLAPSCIKEIVVIDYQDHTHSTQNRHHLHFA